MIKIKIIKYPLTYMLHKFNFILNFILILGFVGCSNNTDKGNAKKTINMKVEKEELLTLKNYVDSTVYVKLETDTNVLIRSINRINIFDKKIFINDSKLKSLFVFDMTGKFLYKIHNVGMGPAEYNSFTSFSIDRNKKLVFIHDLSKNSIYKYSTDNGEFKGVIRIKDRKSFARDITVMESGDYLCYSHEYIKEAFCGFWLLDSVGNFKKQLWKQTDVFPYGSFEPNPIFIKQYENSIYTLFDAVNNDLYHYDGNKMTKEYHFDFSKLPISSISMHSGLTPNERYSKKMTNIVQIANIHETSNYIWSVWECNNKEHQTFYDKSKQKLIWIGGYDDYVLGRLTPTDNLDIICFEIPARECNDLLKSDKNNEMGLKLKELMKQSTPNDNSILQIKYMKK